MKKDKYEDSAQLLCEMLESLGVVKERMKAAKGYAALIIYYKYKKAPVGQR